MSNAVARSPKRLHVYLETLSVDERHHVERFVAYPKTFVPQFDIHTEFPMLVPTKTTILHPRRVEKTLPITASKIGGHIYWPRTEPWPYCDDEGHTCNPLVAVMQLRKGDVPALNFPPGKNLFQMLWCPTTCHDSVEALYAPKSLFLWRTIDDDEKNADLLTADEEPIPEDYTLREDEFIPHHECALYPERVTEYPDLATLGDLRTQELVDKLTSWLKENLKSHTSKLEQLAAYDFIDYNMSWSASPGTKVGGYVTWIQDHAANYDCQKCGNAMEHLLSVASWEYGARWFPVGEEDVELEQHGMIFGDAGNYFVFACRTCEDMPTQTFIQCS